MALIKQVVSVASGTVANVAMSPAEEAAFTAQQGADAITAAERALRAEKVADAEQLHEKILEALVVGDPANPQDVADYKRLMAELNP